MYMCSNQARLAKTMCISWYYLSESNGSVDKPPLFNLEKLSKVAVLV